MIQTAQSCLNMICGVQGKPVLLPNGFLLPVPPTSGNPESLLSGGHPGIKSFQKTPKSPFYMAWRPGFAPTNAEFNSDVPLGRVIFCALSRQVCQEICAVF